MSQREKENAKPRYTQLDCCTCCGNILCKLVYNETAKRNNREKKKKHTERIRTTEVKTEQIAGKGKTAIVKNTFTDH